MSTAHSDPHWYLDPVHFQDASKHSGLLQIIKRMCHEQLSAPPEAGEGMLVHRSALEHYLATYGSPELPPSWLMVETLTIGQLDHMIRNLRLKVDRSAIAASVGLNEKVLRSWMRTYVRVRNICAHHGRLWNVGLGVYPAIPNSPTISWLCSQEALPDRSKKRLYPVLVSLQSVLDSVSPRSSWARRLHELVAARPGWNRSGMGIPEAWADDPFWSRHIG
ncbi:Abi family protein [Saccharomonospora iraqiensis]|uniref:Abi family protein n=1 Tax=Saccharomonospora iraqiensis TaxID=52698 RepID=UPI001F1E67D9|nr:Abi family protein [Saccharomonospora iraqiensis]